MNITAHWQLGMSSVTVHAKISWLQLSCCSFLTVHWIVYFNSASLVYKGSYQVCLPVVLHQLFSIDKKYFLCFYLPY